MTKFIFKANNDVLSHCACENEPGTSTGQFDCPWCGCGWLISCSKCGKAFTYAIVQNTDVSMIELGRQEVERRGITGVTEEEISEWAEDMASVLEPFNIGDIIVYLDGRYFALDDKNTDFEGYFAKHKLDQLPHSKALETPSSLEQVLGNKKYWLDRELPERE